MGERALEIKHDWSADQWDWPLQKHDGVARVHNDKDHFEVGLEVPYFRPDEIQVKVLGQKVMVYCLHEERADKHGTVKREVHRVYELPHDVDPSSVSSRLDAKGILAITGKKKH